MKHDQSLVDLLGQTMIEMTSRTPPPPPADGKYLSRGETRRQFSNYIKSWSSVADGIVRIVEETSESDSIKSLMRQQAAYAFLRAGDYGRALRTIDQILNNGPENEDIQRLKGELTELNAEQRKWDANIIHGVVEHYIRSQLTCDLLSGAVDCKQPISSLVLTNVNDWLTRFLYSPRYTFFNVEGSC